jgi:hypothetical protein
MQLLKVLFQGKYKIATAVVIMLFSPFPGANLVMGPDGLPTYQGMHWATFTVLVPRGLYNSSRVGKAVQYGHGLFGSQKEVLDAYIQKQSNQYDYVMVASNWLGLCEEDEAEVGIMIATNLTRFKMVPDRTQQGVLQALMVMQLLVEGRFALDPAMANSIGQPLLTPKPVTHYFGNSLGGILGTIYLSVSDNVNRGNIGVGGGPFAFLLPRSLDFAALYEVLKVRYLDPLARSFLFSFLQTRWVPGCPSGYVNLLRPGKGKEVLFQHGLADAQVTFLGGN